MKFSAAVFSLSLILAIPLLTMPTAAAADGLADAELTATIAALDTAAFDAFNRCDQPGQLDRYASYFASDIEFYHDQGGVTWTREAMIENTANNVCGKFRRELVPGSLRVYPIKKFGALAQGEHTFCRFDSDTCEGIADFAILWRLHENTWQATRVLSYGHRANPAVATSNTEPAQAAAEPFIADPLRADQLRARLDEVIPPLLSQHGVASVSIARIEAGQILLSSAYGSQQAGLPASTTSLYNIASMTKPISAEVAMRLVAAQRIRLDEAMAPTWTDPDIADDPRSKLLTPRLALSHRTGFPNWRYQTEDRLQFLHTPGTVFGYSGEGIEYLARFIEKKTGEDFEALAQQLVFDPAGMRDAAYTHRTWFEGRIALPTDADGKALTPQIAEQYIASDDLYTTPTDYALFLLSLIRQQGVDAALAAERARVHSDRRAELCTTPARKAACPDATGFGLGWEVFRFGADTYLMHTGMDTGVFSLGYFNADSGSGSVIFTSGGSGAQLVLPILDAIDRDAEFVGFLRELTR